MNQIDPSVYFTVKADQNKVSTQSVLQSVHDDLVKRSNLSIVRAIPDGYHMKGLTHQRLYFVQGKSDRSSHRHYNTHGTGPTRRELCYSAARRKPTQLTSSIYPASKLFPRVQNWI